MPVSSRANGGGASKRDNDDALSFADWDMTVWGALEPDQASLNKLVSRSSADTSKQSTTMTIDRNLRPMDTANTLRRHQSADAASSIGAPTRECDRTISFPPNESLKGSQKNLHYVPRWLDQQTSSGSHGSVLNGYSQGSSRHRRTSDTVSKKGAITVDQSTSTTTRRLAPPRRDSASLSLGLDASDKSEKDGSWANNEDDDLSRAHKPRSPHRVSPQGHHETGKHHSHHTRKNQSPSKKPSRSSSSRSLGNLVISDSEESSRRRGPNDVSERHRRRDEDHHSRRTPSPRKHQRHSRSVGHVAPSHDEALSKHHRGKHTTRSSHDSSAPQHNTHHRSPSRHRGHRSGSVQRSVRRSNRRSGRSDQSQRSSKGESSSRHRNRSSHGSPKRRCSLGTLHFDEDISDLDDNSFSSYSRCENNDDDPRATFQSKARCSSSRSLNLMVADVRQQSDRRRNSTNLSSFYNFNDPEDEDETPSHHRLSSRHCNTPREHESHRSSSKKSRDPKQPEKSRFRSRSTRSLRSFGEIRMSRS